MSPILFVKLMAALSLTIISGDNEGRLFIALAIFLRCQLLYSHTGMLIAHVLS